MPFAFLHIGALASTTRSGTDAAELFSTVLPWLGVLMVLVLIGGAAILLLRRSLQSGGGAGSEGFSLQSLRDLHAAGELTDEEFERAKQAMIGGYRKANTDAPPEGAAPDDSPPKEPPAGA